MLESYLEVTKSYSNPRILNIDLFRTILNGKLYSFLCRHFLMIFCSLKLQANTARKGKESIRGIFPFMCSEKVKLKKVKGIIHSPEKYEYKNNVNE